MSKVCQSCGLEIPDDSRVILLRGGLHHLECLAEEAPPDPLAALREENRRLREERDELKKLFDTESYACQQKHAAMEEYNRLLRTTTARLERANEVMRRTRTYVEDKTDCGCELAAGNKSELCDNCAAARDLIHDIDTFLTAEGGEKCGTCSKPAYDHAWRDEGSGACRIFQPPQPGTAGAMDELLWAATQFVNEWADVDDIDLCGCVGASDDCKHPPVCGWCKLREVLRLAQPDKETFQQMHEPLPERFTGPPMQPRESRGAYRKRTGINDSPSGKGGGV